MAIGLAVGSGILTSSGVFALVAGLAVSAVALVQSGRD